MDNVMAMDRIELHKQTDRRLLPYFTLDELTDSPTASKQDIDNTPGAQETASLIAICKKLLTPIREHYALPMRITSGYRCEALNKAVGGAERSYHLYGKAIDFKIMGVDNLIVARWLETGPLSFDQMILEYHQPNILNAGWIHISYDDLIVNRGEIWTKAKGKPYTSGLPIYE